MTAVRRCGCSLFAVNRSLPCNHPAPPFVQPIVTTAMVFPTPTGGVPAIDIDTGLAGSAARGDHGAFERLYRRHVTRIHSLARRMSSPDLADDLTQEIFVRAWEKLPSFAGRSSFGTWLHRLAVNHVLTRRRRTRLERAWFIDDDAPIAAAPASTPRPGLAMDIEAAMTRLPEGARQIFVLYDVEGWTHEEIAKQMGITTGTSKSQLSRARATLRRYLSDD